MEAERRDQQTVEGATRRGHGEPENDARRQRHPMGVRVAERHRREGDDRPDRQVDSARTDHDRHRHRDQTDLDASSSGAEQVRRRQEVRRQEAEHDDQHDQHDQQRRLARDGGSTGGGVRTTSDGPPAAVTPDAPWRGAAPGRSTTATRMHPVDEARPDRRHAEQENPIGEHADRAAAPRSGAIAAAAALDARPPMRARGDHLQLEAGPDDRLGAADLGEVHDPAEPAIGR